MTRDEFRKQHCQLCGSQRCDGSDEFMDACHKWREMNLQGLCRSCIRSLWCEEAARFVDMQFCTQYLKVLTSS